VAFHETFWVISGTAAPVIALAIVVSQGTLGDHETEWLEVRSRINDELKDLEATVKQYFGDLAKLLRDGEDANAAPDGEDANAAPDGEDANAAPDGEDANAAPDGEIGASLYAAAETITGAARKRFEGTDRQMRRLLRGTRAVQNTNLIAQAALLCVSMVSVAYQFNLVSPISAIAVAVLGILCLALTTALVYSFKSLVNSLRISKTNTRPPNLKLPEPPEPSTEDLAKQFEDNWKVVQDALSDGSSSWFGQLGKKREPHK
jgi:hypothetical protein